LKKCVCGWGNGEEPALAKLGGAGVWMFVWFGGKNEWMIWNLETLEIILIEREFVCLCVYLLFSIMCITQGQGG
jgi:hypothetical protein